MSTSNNNPSRRVVLVGGGGVGGVGKTIVSIAIADLYHQHKVPHTLIDAEEENKKGGMLTTYFPEAKRLAIDTPGQLDDALRAALAVRLCLVDLGAGSGRVTLPWVERVIPWLQSINTTITLVTPITSHPASVSAAIEWVNALRDSVKYLVIQNKIHGDDFSSLHKSNAGKAFIDGYAPRFITIEKMWSKYINALEQQRLSLGQAREAFNLGDPDKRLGPILGDLVTMFHLEAYFKQIMDQLESVQELLLP